MMSFLALVWPEHDTKEKIGLNLGGEGICSCSIMVPAPFLARVHAEFGGQVLFMSFLQHNTHTRGDDEMI